MKNNNITLVVVFEKLGTKIEFKYNSFYKSHEIGDLVAVFSPEDYINRLGRFSIGKVIKVLETQEKATLVLETLPEPEERDGYYAVRYIDPETKEFSYIYREIVEEKGGLDD